MILWLFSVHFEAWASVVLCVSACAELTVPRLERRETHAAVSFRGAFAVVSFLCSLVQSKLCMYHLQVL